MSGSRLGRLVHDLRAPLARAKTLTKLALELPPAEAAAQLTAVLQALEELERRLRAADASDESGD